MWSNDSRDTEKGSVEWNRVIGQARINAMCNIAYMYPITKTNRNNKHVNAAGLPTHYSIGNLMETPIIFNVPPRMRSALLD